MPISVRLRVIAVCSCALSLVAPFAQAGLNASSTVFVVVMENHNWSEIKGNPNAPYLNSLLATASCAEQYYNPPGLHPSEPNYIWLEAGSNLGILDSNPPAINHQSTTNHFATLLKNAGISWRTYQEDIDGTTCPTTSSGLYAVRHNPFAFFDDVTAAGCTSVMRPITELPGDLNNNAVPHYVFITPNLCHDMHDTCAPMNNSIRQGDFWLEQNLPVIFNSAAYQNGVVLIVWDESEDSDGPIGMIALSPFAKGGGYSNSIYYTHSATLQTLQRIFGVRPLLGDAINGPDLSDLFQAGAIPGSGSTNKLANLSTRMDVGTGDNVLIAGFIVSGSVPKSILIRGLGPSLGDAGIANALNDPVVDLHDSSGAIIASNDNWKTNQQSAIEGTGLPPEDDREAALLMTLPAGNYTAVEHGKGGATGVGLIETYDLNPGADSKMGNMSTRGPVETGDNVMIGGLIVNGNGAGALVLLRALGPSLSDFGLSNPLQDPILDLRDVNGALISSNDEWQQTQGPEIQATGLVPSNVHESAILATLAPGAYTAIVRGKSHGTGIGLVETYMLR